MLDAEFDDDLGQDVQEVALLIADKTEKMGGAKKAHYINFLACLVMVAADFLEISDEEAIGAVVMFMRAQLQHSEKAGQGDSITHH